MSTITIITIIEDAGTSYSVEVLHGEGDSLVQAARKRYEELINQYLQAHEIDAEDDRITEGAEVNGVWEEDSLAINLSGWRDGFVEWKFRECGENYTIRVIGDQNIENPIVKETRVP